MKNIPKEYLEEIVIQEYRKRLTDDSIKLIAKEFSLLVQEENNSPMIKAMEKERNTCKGSIENLMLALEKGKQADLILERIDKKREELREIEEKLFAETAMQSILSEPEIIFFLSELKHGKPNSITG